MDVLAKLRDLVDEAEAERKQPVVLSVKPGMTLAEALAEARAIVGNDDEYVAVKVEVHSFRKSRTEIEYTVYAGGISGFPSANYTAKTLSGAVEMMRAERKVKPALADAVPDGPPIEAAHAALGVEMEF